VEVESQGNVEDQVNCFRSLGVAFLHVEMFGDSKSVLNTSLHRSRANCGTLGGDADPDGRELCVQVCVVFLQSQVVGGESRC
jgi:hypothetical protein